MPLIASRSRSPSRTSSCTPASRNAAIRDPLTGLWNRRHLEVSTVRLFAALGRLELDERRPIAGDPVRSRPLRRLQQAARPHRRRCRPARLRVDPVGPLALERHRRALRRRGIRRHPRRATVDEAQRVADEIRRGARRHAGHGVDGEALRADGLGWMRLAGAGSSRRSRSSSRSRMSPCRWPSAADATRSSPPRTARPTADRGSRPTPPSDVG
jgi:GGDEF domain-containing protein